MSHPLRCRCGALTGLVGQPRKASRGVCYCKDCQAFARYLGDPDRVLDSMGGTDVVATLAKYVSFTSGTDRLACLSLTDRGLLRWYANCCGTPIGNTLRNFRVPYVSLVHTCLGTPAGIEASFGPVRMRVNTKSATGHPKSMPLSQAGALLRFLPTVLLGRLDGSYKTTPFFTVDGTRLDLLKRLRELETPACPFANLPEPRGGRWGQGLTAAKMAECRWVKPELVGQFEFAEWTPDNHLRHSRFVALREDKDPREVTRER